VHKEFQQVLKQIDLEYLESIFNSNTHYYTMEMEKVSIPYSDNDFIKFIHNIIQDVLGIKEDYQIVGDNFYKHQHSYFPHCDAVEKEAWLNIAIPIKQWNVFGKQKFIVFDQTWSGRNITWLGNYKPVKDFESNKASWNRPCDEEHFNGHTFKELPDSIWNHLDQRYFIKDYFFGLSGAIYNWSPGNIILFDSRHIHATGKMQCSEKLGISVRIIKK
jgi:hypothetical protein